MEHINWNGFVGTTWKEQINVQDFINKNYKEYLGDASFLEKATTRTNNLMEKVQALFKLERQKGGVLDIDTETISSLRNYAPGYIDKDNELIVGLQKDKHVKLMVINYQKLQKITSIIELLITMVFLHHILKKCVRLENHM